MVVGGTMPMALPLLLLPMPVLPPQESLALSDRCASVHWSSALRCADGGRDGSLV